MVLRKRGAASARHVLATRMYAPTWYQSIPLMLMRVRGAMRLWYRLPTGTETSANVCLQAESVSRVVHCSM